MQNVLCSLMVFVVLNQWICSSTTVYTLYLYWTFSIFTPYHRSMESNAEILLNYINYVFTILILPENSIATNSVDSHMGIWNSYLFIFKFKLILVCENVLTYSFVWFIEDNTVMYGILLNECHLIEMLIKQININN